MNRIFTIDEISDDMTDLCGGKAVNLASVSHLQRIPETIVVSTDIYHSFMKTTGLDTYLLFELRRRPLDQMRWEELWDISLQIKNRFTTTPFPDEVRNTIVNAIPASFMNTRLAIRSSSPIEDSGTGSFAGLHESYLAVEGVEAILEHITLVWASLFSESALMYRTELSLDQVDSVAMAVVIQKMVVGSVSGVIFSRSPVAENEMVIESVRGLNQGLVDDIVEPDRWRIDRSSGAVLSMEHNCRGSMITLQNQTITETAIASELSALPTLSDDKVVEIFELANKLERHFNSPQDIEWTINDDELILLQCRPITTLKEQRSDEPLWEQEDKRPWYKTLTRSFENLQRLNTRVEKEILPGMERDASAMELCDLTALSDEELLNEIKSRKRIHDHWVAVYWDELIPFAHGSRLFGEYFTMRVKPDDPFEFLKLLQMTPLISIQRNEHLHKLSVMVRQDNKLKEALSTGDSLELFVDFTTALSHFTEQYGDLTFNSERLFQNGRELCRVILALAEKEDPTHGTPPIAMEELEKIYFDAIPVHESEFARDILALGRASYLFRDNDNIILSRVESQLLKAVHEGAHRLPQERKNGHCDLTADEVLFLMEHPEEHLKRTVRELESDEPIEHRGQKTARNSFSVELPGFKMSARQLIGQSAGEGIAKGVARVIEKTEDLFSFQPGEILVCDSIDPNMTFVVPLASAIVERRGGMLVHGAIIAREYGLPCITGVNNLTALISTGTTITVDGYLGIVTVHSSEELDR